MVSEYGQNRSSAVKPYSVLFLFESHKVHEGITVFVGFLLSVLGSYNTPAPKIRPQIINKSC